MTGVAFGEFNVASVADHAFPGAESSLVLAIAVTLDVWRSAIVAPFKLVDVVFEFEEFAVKVGDILFSVIIKCKTNSS